MARSTTPGIGHVVKRLHEISTADVIAGTASTTVACSSGCRQRSTTSWRLAAGLLSPACEGPLPFSDFVPLSVPVRVAVARRPPPPGVRRRPRQEFRQHLRTATAQRHRAQLQHPAQSLHAPSSPPAMWPLPSVARSLPVWSTLTTAGATT